MQGAHAVDDEAWHGMANDGQFALQNLERGNDSLIAPELIFAECGQVLNKKRAQEILVDEELNALLDSILDLPIRLFAHSDLLRPACDLKVSISPLCPCISSSSTRTIGCGMAQLF